MTEWCVKAFIDPSSAAPDGKPTSGTEYLARRRAQRDNAEAALTAAETAAAELHVILGSQAAASSLVARQDRRQTGRTTEMVLNGAYLVGRTEVEDFVRLVDEQGHERARDRLELELAGPLPPYHFVQ
jgi:hypothetical protein